MTQLVLKITVAGDDAVAAIAALLAAVIRESSTKWIGVSFERVETDDGA